MTLDEPLHIKEVGVAAAGAPMRARCIARPREATLRDSPDRVTVAPSSKRQTSARSRFLLWPIADSKPGSREGRSTENCAERGLLIGTIAFRRLEVCGLRAVDERKRERLGTSAARSTSRTRLIWSRSLIRWRGRRQEWRKGGRKPIVAVVPSNLFNEVGLARHVDAEGRNCRRASPQPRLRQRTPGPSECAERQRPGSPDPARAERACAEA